MEYLNSIRAALKGAAPVIAVPVEGHAPICIKAKLFKGALKGVTVDRVELLPNRWLMITGTAQGGVRTCSKFAPMERYAALKMVGEWAIKERAKTLKIINQGVLSAKEQKAMKLKKAEEAGFSELRKAQKDVQEIYARAKAQMNPVLVPVDEETRAELVQEYSAFRHNRRNRKRGAVIRWKLKKLREEKALLVKLEGPRHHKKTVLRKKTDSLKYAALVYQIGKLNAQYDTLYPPKWHQWRYSEDPKDGIWEDSWQDKRSSDQAYTLPNKYTFEHYNRAAEVSELLEACANVRALTPPEDELEIAA